MCHLLEEIGTNLEMEFAKQGILHSTVFEDNNGALDLATSLKLTPRTKHIGVKYHFFKSHVGEDKEIRIVPIDTLVQKADIFTKGLDFIAFGRIRKLLMGW